MGKVNNMASLKQRLELKENIVKLKNDFDLTYSSMTIRLGNPCTPATLQVRALYPKKTCSLKLYMKIQDGIQELGKQRTEKQEYEKIKKEFIDEITELTSKYFKKIESFTSLE